MLHFPESLAQRKHTGDQVAASPRHAALMPVWQQPSLGKQEFLARTVVEEQVLLFRYPASELTGTIGSISCDASTRNI